MQRELKTIVGYDELSRRDDLSRTVVDISFKCFELSRGVDSMSTLDAGVLMEDRNHLATVL